MQIYDREHPPNKPWEPNSSVGNAHRQYSEVIIKMLQSTTKNNGNDRPTVPVIFPNHNRQTAYTSCAALPLNFSLEGLGLAPIFRGTLPTATRPSFTFSGKTPSAGCKYCTSPLG
jgi:hypothetical protein